MPQNRKKKPVWNRKKGKQLHTLMTVSLAVRLHSIDPSPTTPDFCRKGKRRVPKLQTGAATDHDFGAVLLRMVLGEAVWMWRETYRL